MKKLWRPLIVLAVSLVVAGAVLYGQPRKVDLIVDNGFPCRLQVQVNGEKLGKVLPRASFKVHDLQAGTLRLVAQELGPSGELGREHSLEAPAPAGFFAPRPTYVWNVEGRTARYWIVSRGYGDQKTEPSVPLEPKGQLFAVPAGLIPSLDGDLPATAQAPKGTTGTIRKTLWTDHYFSGQRITRKLQGIAPAKIVPGAPGDGD